MTKRGRETRNGVSCIPPVIPMDRAALPWLNMWVTCGRSWRAEEVLFCSAVGQIWQYCEWKERGRGSGATLLQFQCKRGKEKGGWGGWLNRSSLTPPFGLLSEL